MKKHVFILLFSLLFEISAFSQVMFVDRFEIPSNFIEKDFIVVAKQGGLVAFRVQPEKGLNFKSNLQYFLTDFNLNSDNFKEIKVRDGYDLVGYDLEGEFLYILMQKGSVATSERYLIEIDLKSEVAQEVLLENIYSMELQEFFVLNRSAIFMGNADLRPIVQIFDIQENNVITVQGIYFKDTKILQLKKESELGVLDLLVSRRDKYKMKQISLLTFDDNGNKIREVVIEKLEDQDMELVEGIMTPIQNYQQSIIGTFGNRKREAYQGIYLGDINEFGEYKIKYLTLENFPNFFNYMKEKQKEKKLQELEKSFAKGKTPSIKPVFSAREVLTLDQGYLVYSDHFLATNPRYMQRDGVYANEAYRYSANRLMMDQLGYGLGRYGNSFPGSRYGGTYVWQEEGEYEFVSSYFLFLNRSGEVIWDNSLDLTGNTTNNPGKYGEISFDGEKLHFLYLDDIQIYMSYIKNGEVIFQNKTFEIELINEEERIRETQDGSLSLTHWYSNYFLLTGKQKVRYLNAENKEETKEVFFLTKIKVDGDQYVPEDEEDLGKN
ncbi:transcriptional regulator [Aquiflexum gelatinilyticum]|uniref:transcriptional regulator n=1 Tax=Aquiflexum gelatinilyticum TaxID=2961943 RepID=UPI002167D892|nr:transcriptional regulator [Aquiflexum gelatinilyticum]MCS4434149.1 transcriptional regulator [Aquiflexum gelatinilyticum]